MKRVTRRALIVGGVVLGIAGLSWLIKYASDSEETMLAQSEIPITGTVLAENRNCGVENVPGYEGFFSYSNPTVSVDCPYVFRMETDDGRVLGVEVMDSRDVSAASLDVLIEPGTRVSFPQGNLAASSGCSNTRLYEEADFSQGGSAGRKYASRITVLE